MKKIQWLFLTLLTLVFISCSNNSSSGNVSDSPTTIHPDSLNNGDTVLGPMDRDSSGRATLQEDSNKARN